MRSLVIKIFFGCLLSFSSIIFAGEPALWASEFCSNNKQRCRVLARHIERGGIGYDQGYTSIDAFLAADPASCKVMPFLDLRGHIFDNGKFAANAGVGLRSIVKCRSYGANIYYDFRNTKRLNYNQVGFGLETLGKLWDIRINGYLPCGKQVTDPFDIDFAALSENYVLLAQKYQLAMRGANAELGFHFGCRPNVELYAAAGPYYFNGKNGPNMWGGKVRLIASFKQYWTIELSDSYDKVFCNRFQGELTFSLPLGRGSKPGESKSKSACDMQDPLYCRMVQPVVRQEIVVVDCQKKCCPALDPLTNEPLRVIFVDNTSNSRGTYESPYPTLALAQAHSKAGDIIYVYPGDGTTKGMNAGIVLKNNQKFWGSGVEHSLQTALGTITIPAQSSTAPTMTNSDGDGITLAGINQVSGITVTNTFGRGITGTNLKNIDISQCTLDASLDDQIHLEYSGASGIATLSNLIIKNGSNSGIFVDSSALASSCAISNCTMQNNGVFAVDASFAQKAVMSLNNNTIDGNENGGFINCGGSSTLVVSDNTFSNTTSVSARPLTITTGASPVTTSIVNNIFKDNVCGALQFLPNDTDGATLIIRDNTITNNSTGAVGSGFGSALLINPNGTTSGNCTLTVKGNSFSDNASNALYCTNGGFNKFTVNAVDNTMTDNGGSGLVFNNPCTTFTLTATDNSILRGGDNGIATVGGVAMTTADITILNNTITDHTGSANGIAFTHEGTALNMVIRDNTISNNEGSGILAYHSTIIENVTANISNNTINNNQNLGSNAAGGLDLEQYTNLAATIKNNTLLGNATNGVYMSSVDASPAACVTMSGNNTDTDYVLDAGTGTFNLAPCNVETVNTGSFTLNGITKVQSCPGGVPCP